MDFLTTITISTDTDTDDSNATSGSASGLGGTGGNRTGPRPAAADVLLSYQVATSLLLAALVLCSAFGNACVVAAIALERSLQNVANYLIGSLAVTDLMVSVLVLPMAALYQVLNKWTLGQTICDIFISLDVLCCTSSILHLCAIALDRYWAITDPIDYVNKRTPRRAAVLISVTWLIGFSISIPPMLGWRSAEDRADPDACTISQDPGYTVYSTFGAFYIPLVLMLVLYGKIFRAARFRIRKTVVKKTEVAITTTRSFSASPAPLHKKANGEAPGAPCVNGAPCVKGAPGRTREEEGGEGCEEGESLEIIEVMGNSKTHLPLPNTPQSSSHASCGEYDRGGSSDARRKMAMARERKAVKTLGIIMGTFIVCWLPFFIVALVLPFCAESCFMPDWLVAVINWLGYSNSLLNPIIYAYFNKDFQSAFQKIMRCKFHRH
ncbi:5-hydroxytryptamine receptor 1A-alpha [Merluccius polli]|uniref:5-hydroxytryptamine receptor 1A-alpha n=1 Tax=Merluccius polli TaxID=89951 RepID=A0AA47N6S3_MERPO|nr:5-hydroxytryptamine receptor 1A-alpha [Merluccius polli]